MCCELPRLLAVLIVSLDLVVFRENERMYARWQAGPRDCVKMSARLFLRVVSPNQEPLLVRVNRSTRRDI